MPRPPRVFFEGAIHHIIARGNNKMNLFLDSNDFRVYRKLWILAKPRFKLKIYRWAFMTNHVHFLLEQIQAVGVAEAMHLIQGRYARYFCRKYAWKGHVWESRYSNRLIADEQYFLRCARYIEANPVKAGLAVRPQDYRWSSAGFYTFQHRDQLTDKDPYSELGLSGDSDTSNKQELFIGRRAVGNVERLIKLSKKVGQNLVSRPRRQSIYQD